MSGIIDGSLQLGYKDLAWFNAHASLVLLEGQIVYLQQTGQFKIGNGVDTLATLQFLGISAETQDLQAVTDLGSVTTNDIEANSFIKTGGASTEFLKADGSVDTTQYYPNSNPNGYINAETQTLQDVTDNGNVTTNTVEASGFVKTGGTSSQFLKADGTIDSNTYLTTENQTLQNVTDNGSTTTNAIDTAGITTDYVQLDTTATNTNAVGKIIWNDTDGTANLGLKGGNVVLQIGQEHVVRVVNKSGVNLLESNYQVVKIVGATGQRLSIDLAQADNDANSASTLALVTETINNNQEGFCTVLGQIHDINTTGSLQGETWNDGDILYLSGTTAGAITNVKPSAPIHTIILGYVEYAHAIHGKIYVKIDNGYELEELHNVQDVSYSTPVDADSLLVKDNSTSLWKRLTWSNLKATIKTYFDTIYQKIINTYATVVYVNATNPTSATIFDTSNPPTVNNNALKTDANNIYIGTDGSTWVYNVSSSTYVTYTVPNATEWYLGGTTSDAGSNKTNLIYRTGQVNIGNKTITGQRTLRIGDGTASADLGSLVGTSSAFAMYTNQTTPNTVNYTLMDDTSSIYLNGKAANSLYFQIGATNVHRIGTNFQLLTPTAAASGSVIKWQLTVPADTTMTASTNIPSWKILNANRQWNTGTLTNQYWAYITAPTASFVGASTLTNSYSLFIEKAIAGFNANITNNYALGVDGLYASGNINLPSLTSAVKSQILTYDTTTKNVSYFTFSGTVFKDTTNSSDLTGTTEQIAKSILIPANTFTTGDIIFVEVRNRKTSSAGATDHYIKVNTTNSLTSAIQVGTLNTTATGFIAGFSRNLCIKSASVTETVTATTSFTTDLGQPTGASDLNIDWTVNQYLIISIKNATGTDTCRNSYLTISKK